MNRELSKLSLEELNDLKEEINRFFNNDLFKFPRKGLVEHLTLPVEHYNLLIRNIIEDSELKFTFVGADMIIFDLNDLKVKMSNKYKHNLQLAKKSLYYNYDGFSDRERLSDVIKNEKELIEERFLFENNIKAINNEISNIENKFGIKFIFSENFEGYEIEINEKSDEAEIYISKNKEEIEKENIIEDDKITKESNEHEITHSKKDSLIKRIIKRAVKF